MDKAFTNKVREGVVGCRMLEFELRATTYRTNQSTQGHQLLLHTLLASCMP